MIGRKLVSMQGKIQLGETRREGYHLRISYMENAEPQSRDAGFLSSECVVTVYGSRVFGGCVEMLITKTNFVIRAKPQRLFLLFQSWKQTTTTDMLAQGIYIVSE